MSPKTKLLMAISLAAAGLLARSWSGEENPRYEPLVVAGESTQGNGICNPSMAYTLDGKTGWLVYSAIRQGGKYLKQVPIGPYCETHLAGTADGGKTWTFVQAINRSVDDMLKNYDGQKLPGVWRYDAPSLVHDPGDPGREWKVFTHSYFWNLQNDRMPAYGWISMQTASDPAGEWTAPQPLFGSDLYPPKPYQFTRINVNALDKSLRGTLVYTEPGAYCFQRYGTLYLSLTALIRTGPEKVVLLTSADHGNTWSFVSTLVTNADAAPLGYKRFDGSAITEQAGRVFFLVSPDNGTAEHFGTLVIEFDDLYTGRLQRGADGKLLVQKHIHAPGDSKADAGRSCYDEHNTHGGVLLPQVNTKNAPQIFQIWSTHQSLIGGQR